MRNSTVMISLAVAAVSCTSAPKPVTTTRVEPPPPAPVFVKAPTETFRGVARYEDGSPASGALLEVTNLTSQKALLLAADRNGRFAATLDAGEHALAITTEDGFGWVEKIEAPNVDATVTVSRACKSVRGRVKGAPAGTQVALTRLSPLNGDIFVASSREDGTFALCLPEALYRAEARGATLSLDVRVDLFGDVREVTNVELDGFAKDVIQQPPREIVPVRAELDSIVADIVRREARLVGLGEATHGNLEMTTSRAQLTFELVRRADLRLVLFEVDAILATAIDDYVMGRNVDLPKAVAALGFWITDTHELLKFFEDLRAHNATTRHKVRVWGMDVQNIEPPIALLLANARALKLTADDKATLTTINAKRGRPVLELPPARRAALDALFARLVKPRGKRDLDLRIAVAARSLQVQVGYFEGNTSGLYGERRDAGMAALTSFLVEQTGVKRAAVWAHAAHVAREPQTFSPTMGTHLARVEALRYYPVGIYVYEGSVRAWDPGAKIGVISHPIPAAPSYTLEGAVMAATGSPEIAWLPVDAFPPALRTWANTPRYVRELGWGYVGEENMRVLRSIPGDFDAVGVIKTGHDSSPTPTGIRKVEQ